MVIVLLAQAAVTPFGNPVAVPIPVAPVVLCVILVNVVLIQREGVLDAILAVLMQGVTDVEANDAAELPTAFVATTVKV
jgi:hypothetical protein